MRKEDHANVLQWRLAKITKNVKYLGSLLNGLTTLAKQVTVIAEIKTLRKMGALIEMKNDHAPIKIYPTDQIIGLKEQLLTKKHD